MRPTVAILGFGLLGCSPEPEGGTPGGYTWVALAPRTATDGPRFRRLPPSETGVEFTNLLRDENVIPYIYSGAGVAVGDYDRDGLPDLYLVSQDGPNRLFRQVAPLRFEDVTEAAGGLDGGEAWGTAATFADVDGDRDLDLYVCNTEAPNLLYRNEGDGTFREVGGRQGLAVVRASTGAAFADYDNDGDLDLYLLTNRVFGPKMPEPIVREVTLPADTTTTIDEMFPPHPRFELDAEGGYRVPEGYEEFFFTIGDKVFPTGQRDILFRNDGYAQWRDVTDSAGVAHFGQGLSVTWWDYDADGDLDLYVANDIESPDKLFRNRGDGTFDDVTRDALPHTAYFGMGADFGDIDNDGRLDFCVADMSSTTHYMSKLLMGHMGDKRWFLMNADPPQYMRNAVYVNTGTDRFAEAAHLTGLASTDWTWAVRFADLDDDGWVDFFAANGMAMFDNDPDANAEFTKLWRAGVRDAALEVVRRLGRVDERNIARRNRGEFSFEDVGAAWGLDEAGVGNGAAIADLDRDGDLDIVVNNTNAPASIFENRTTATHRVLVELRGRDSNAFGVGARIELEAAGLQQVRLVMPTRGYMSAGEAVEHFGLGDADHIDRLRVEWPSGCAQEFEDLPADRHYTFEEPERSKSRAADPAPEPETLLRTLDLELPRHVEREFDDYAVQPLLPHRLSRFGPGIACSDVDGDGRDDLWIGGAAGQPGTLALARDDGTFEFVDGPWREDFECEDTGAAFLDHDGDGDLDLLVASGSIEHPAGDRHLADRLYDNLGDGRFARVDALPADRRFPSTAVALADYDRDGDLDAFVGSHAIRGRYPEPAPSTLYRNDGGRFVPVDDPLFARLGLVTAATWADDDGDGWPDLWVAARWQPIRVLRNDEGEFTDATDRAGLAEIHGQWNSIVGADLDGDGDTDFVAGNLGLNTKYKADAAHPMRLFARDFDDDGVRDVVESKYEGDRLLPVRGRSCSTSAMPFLGEKFETFQAFAKATLPEIYGRDALAESQELMANRLDHVVLENRAGGFSVRALPRLAQISSAYGIVVEDLDGDLLPEILIAHNSFSPEPETGRFDGGLGAVLRNRGGCRFEFVAPTRSGFVVPGDGQAFVRVQRGSPAAEFVVARNDDAPRAFTCERDGVVVRLRDRSANVHGIGARIEFAQGRRRATRTLTAGAGYLSQSSPSAFFATEPTATTTVRASVRWPDGETTHHELVARGVHVLSR